MNPRKTCAFTRFRVLRTTVHQRPSASVACANTIRRSLVNGGGHGCVNDAASWAFTDRARASGLVPSMGSIGDCYDNAMIESFWGRVQTELLNRQRWRTRIELANALFEYLEIFHNRQRRHSSLGMLTPIEYELNINQTEPVA